MVRLWDLAFHQPFVECDDFKRVQRERFLEGIGPQDIHKGQQKVSFMAAIFMAVDGGFMAKG